jgi:hypothetical protein
MGTKTCHLVQYYFTFGRFVIGKVLLDDPAETRANAYDVFREAGRR